MPSVPLDMRRIAQAAVDAAFDQLEESKQKSNRKARLLPPKRALLAGAALATAGRLAWSSRGQGLLDSLEGRLSGLVGDHGPSEPEVDDVEDVQAPEVGEELDEPEAEEEPEEYDEEADEPEAYEDEDQEYEEEPEEEADEPEAEGEEDFEEDEVDDEDSEPDDDRPKRPKARSRSKRRN